MRGKHKFIFGGGELDLYLKEIEEMKLQKIDKKHEGLNMVLNVSMRFYYYYFT